MCSAGGDLQQSHETQSWPFVNKDAVGFLADGQFYHRVQELLNTTRRQESAHCMPRLKHQHQGGVWHLILLL